jgi:hypothetical protein
MKSLKALFNLGGHYRDELPFAILPSSISDRSAKQGSQSTVKRSFFEEISCSDSKRELAQPNESSPSLTSTEQQANTQHPSVPCSALLRTLSVVHGVFTHAHFVYYCSLKGVSRLTID